jgi:hypothetical protein
VIPEHGACATEASGSDWSPVRLRRDGLQPLRFLGRLVARHDGQAPHAVLWHDLALYRTALTGYAVEIVVRYSPAPGITPPQSTCSHATLCDTLDDAMTLFESYDPLRDLCPGVTAPAPGFDNPAISPVTLAIQSAALLGFSRDVVRRYGIGVGDFLNSLCLAGV